MQDACFRDADVNHDVSVFRCTLPDDQTKPAVSLFLIHGNVGKRQKWEPGAKGSSGSGITMLFAVLHRNVRTLHSFSALKILAAPWEPSRHL